MLVLATGALTRIPKGASSKLERALQSVWTGLVDKAHCLAGIAKRASAGQTWWWVLGGKGFFGFHGASSGLLRAQCGFRAEHLGARNPS